MKSIVSSLVLVAVLASAGVNAAPATGSEKALTQKTGSVASKPAAVHGAIANSAKDTEPAGQHALSSTPKKQTLSKTSTTTSTTQHGSKKDKKRTRKHRKTQGEETGQKTKTKTKSNLSKSKSKSKDHLPASQNTPSASRTDRETSASLAKPKSENQPRDVVEAEEALYARRLPSRAQLKRIAEKIKNAKAKNAAGKSAKDGDQDTRDLTSDSLSSRELEEALEARFVKKLKQKWRESKANRLQKAATKAQGKADAAATKVGMNTEQSDARDIIEDEFEARDLADESDVLEARRSRWRKFAKSTPTDEPTDKREFEDDLAAREYFDEELEMREFDEDEDLFAREYFDDDELAARDYEDWEARDVSDEFDLRDFVEIDELD